MAAVYVDARTFPITLEFDPDTPPEVPCKAGAPRFQPPPKGLPLGDDIRVDNPYILRYMEKYYRCFCDNFLNNAEHLDVSKMFSQLVTDDTNRCIFLSDGTKECKKMKTRFAQLEMISNKVDVTKVSFTVVEVHPYSLRVKSTMECMLEANVFGFLIGHTVCRYTSDILYISFDI